MKICKKVMTPKGRALEKVRRHAGGKAKFRIRVTNMGTDAARNVVVCDLLPKQFKLIKASVKVTYRNGRPCVRLPLLKGQRQGFITVRIAKTAKRHGDQRRRGQRPRQRQTPQHRPGARAAGESGGRRSHRLVRGRAAAAMLAVAAAAAGAAPASAADRPSAPTRARAWIAELVARTPAWPQPAAGGLAADARAARAVDRRPGRLLVLRVRGRWVQVRLPNRPNRAAAWVSADRVVLRPTRWRVEIDVGARQVSALRDGRVVRRFGAVVGTPATPTPRGRFAIYEVDRQPDPFGFLGPVALHLTAHSNVLDDYGGGPGRVALHGRGGASLADPLGSAASHGCIRVDSGQAAWLSRVLRPGVPVTVR